jgi:hypothetical protein
MQKRRIGNIGMKCRSQDMFQPNMLQHSVLSVIITTAFSYYRKVISRQNSISSHENLSLFSQCRKYLTIRDVLNGHECTGVHRCSLT